MMGSGGARELGQANGPLDPLPEELAKQVSAALEKMDALDPTFKERRDDELYTQNVKVWNSTSKEIDGHLRVLARVLIGGHQLSLDIGSDGGGASTKPWLEETSMSFDRLYFKLKNGTEVHATYKDETFDIGTIEQAVQYEWVEQMVVKWIVLAVSQKG